MTDHLHSKIAKAEAKTHIEKAEKKALKKAAAQAKPPIATTRTQVKALWAQYPKEARLFGHIMAKWRASSAIRPGIAGFWAAYTHPQWEGFTGIDVSTLKRYLDRLEGWGLIERDHGAFGGKPQISFIRPSRHGLRLSSPKDRDWKHLGTTEAETLYPTSEKPKEVPPPPVVKAVPVTKDDDPPMTIEQVLAILNAPANGPETPP